MVSAPPWEKEPSRSASRSDAPATASAPLDGAAADSAVTRFAAKSRSSAICGSSARYEVYGVTMPNRVASSTISSITESRAPSIRTSVRRSATRRCAQTWPAAGSAVERAGSVTSYSKRSRPADELPVTVTSIEPGSPYRPVRSACCPANSPPSSCGAIAVTSPPSISIRRSVSTGVEIRSYRRPTSESMRSSGAT